MNGFLRSLYLVFFFVWASICCNAQTFQVKVVKISDGDTFIGLNSDTLQIKFRLLGIDAPEKKQAFSNKSKNHLSSLIYGKTIMVSVQKQDKWGRYLAYAYTPDMKDVSLEMIKAGMAWHFVRYSNSEEYQEAENLARKNKIGLWSDSNPIEPWDFRRK